MQRDGGERSGAKHGDGSPYKDAKWAVHRELHAACACAGDQSSSAGIITNVRNWSKAAAISALVACAVAQEPASLSRIAAGPIVQKVTDSSAEIMWLAENQ